MQRLDRPLRQRLVCAFQGVQKYTVPSAKQFFFDFHPSFLCIASHFDSQDHGSLCPLYCSYAQCRKDLWLLVRRLHLWLDATSASLDLIYRHLRLYMMCCQAKMKCENLHGSFWLECIQTFSIFFWTTS